jgi:hypothetical protein
LLLCVNCKLWIELKQHSMKACCSAESNTVDKLWLKSPALSDVLDTYCSNYRLDNRSEPLPLAL